MPTPDPLTDPVAAKDLSPTEWVELHLGRYKKVEGNFRAYADFLVKCLAEACTKIAPKAKIESRAKSPASFAEKILRKRTRCIDPLNPEAPDPLVRLTDLCGGRVITETSAEVEAVCKFIEKAFEIDLINSEDVRERLKPTEFGYRSVHYIVIPNETKLKAAGISTPIPPQILGLKAELQVRTLLEHAWSDLGHDLLYKSDLTVPNTLKRQFAAVAAVLESADREFERLIADFGDYKASLGSHHSYKELVEQIERFEIVLKHEPAEAGIALNLGRVARAIGELQQGIAALDTDPLRGKPLVGRMLGILLTEQHWDSPRSAEFLRGRDFLQRAVAEGRPDAEVLRILAEYRANVGEPAIARELFRQAMAVDSTDPETVSRYLEFESERLGYPALQVALPMICAAIGRAHKQIEARVNLPGAWSALSILHLLEEEPFKALSALSQLIALCRNSRAEAGKAAPPCAACRALLRTRASVRRLQTLTGQIKGLTWFDRLLLISHAVILDDAEAKEWIAGLESNRLPMDGPGEPVIMLAGGCARDVDTAMRKLGPRLIEAAKDIPFTLISGGTENGITALAGDMAQAYPGHIKNVGYVPLSLYESRRNEGATARRAFLNHSTGHDFSPLEPLQAWTDLIAAGVDLERVRVLCYAPGNIARTEIVIGLGLGARVGVIEDPDLPEVRRFEDPHWTGAKGFLPLPMDVSTLRVFLTLDTTPLSDEEKRQFEPAAKMAHQNYVASATPKDPSLQPWGNLDESLKESNYHQVVFWKKILAGLKLNVRALTEEEKQHKDNLPKLLDMKEALGEELIDELARLEHGRWNVERLAYGWRYAREKDIAKRLSPYLVPWEQIPKNIQKYDVDAIVDLPKKLRAVNLQIEKAPDFAARPAGGATP
jgi:ppGpp synthetase/RelA/SpoT-type nucleotidyltranferase